MKIKVKKANREVYSATYEKQCSCCGRKFRATYPSNDYYAYRAAKDIVDSNFNAHCLFCREAAQLEHIA